MNKKSLLILVISIFLSSLAFADDVRLSPKMRVISNDKNSGMISDWSKQFLDIQIIKDPKVVKTFPRVISDKTGKVMSVNNDEIYVDKLSKINYLQPIGVYRIGSAITKPNSKDVVGYPFYFLSDAKLQNLDVDNELSLVKLSSVDKEVIMGDRILNKPNNKFTVLRKNKGNISGNVLSIIDGVNNADNGQTIVLDLGKESKIRNGDLLSIERTVSVKQSVQMREDKFFTRDHFLNRKRDKNAAKKVILPSETIATVLVYSVFDNTSLALIVDSKYTVNLKDKVSSYKKLVKKT